MKVLVVGGGSGGHVTPIVAVLRELKALRPNITIRFWCDRKFASQTKKLLSEFDNNIVLETILSGKFRRYHHLKWWQHITSLGIALPNIRDAVYVGLGTIQSLAKLLLYRPDVIFIKGGFVGVPVGIAAHWLRIPIVIHDSDAHPGLANRIVSRWAARIGTGAPLNYYNYPAAISQYVGIPISDKYVPHTTEMQNTAKQAAGFDTSRPLVVITGGGLGAKRLNDAVMKVLPDLLDVTNVVLIAGASQYTELKAIRGNDDNFKLFGFVSKEMETLLGAADIVVTRAGATAILEVAALSKTAILVPNGFLSGGHQLKNASVYAENNAVEIINETQLHDHPELLRDMIIELLNDPAKRQNMARKLHGFSKPNAAKDVARLIIEAAKKP